MPGWAPCMLLLCVCCRKDARMFTGRHKVIICCLQRFRRDFECRVMKARKILYEKSCSSQSVSLKFLAVISFKFTYACFGCLSAGTCCGGSLAAALQRCRVLRDRLHIPPPLLEVAFFFFSPSSHANLHAALKTKPEQASSLSFPICPNSHSSFAAALA